jgi:3',5'-cyclic AMP phosphodiesterase CpdA
VTRLLQVSDPHFGTERAPVVQALLDLAAKQKPDVLLLSGDVTQRARRRQFDAARRFVDLVAAPATLVVPGNHDIPLFNLLARVFAPYGGYARAFGRNLEPVFDAPQLLVVTVNTTRRERHVDGEVSPRQVDAVAARIRAAAPNQLRVVVTHHPVLATRPEDAENLLHGREVAVRAWSDAGADIVMGGHIHLPYVRSLRTAYPGLRRDLWTVQAGTAVSSRVRGGTANSVNLLRCECPPGTRGCIVERWDYDGDTSRFVARAEHKLTFEP